ncbi:hypothetical protein MJO28_014382 [Puccinia striiformis f. sp. tritici]|uniref:Uncharacterized protein n=1 Tax=Puccinia striiformis f. sp. tritici TaxID=168172 RepID=A0ACC0DW98_9BASI|nr:hypothetical protein MJO28_014382 [Puccinia striiformis f. sp. tritici]
MSGTDEYYVPGGELPFARIRGEDEPESDGSDTPPATGTGLVLPFNQSEESLESLYHESQTGVEEGRVSAAAAALEQAERERATNQAYLYSKANKGILAQNRERRDGHAARLAERKAAAEADSLSSITERPQPAAGGSGTFTVPTEPVEEDDMSFNDIFGGGPPAGPTTTAPVTPAKKPLTGGKIRPKDHPHVKLDSTDLQKFLERYEKAAAMEGVNSRGMAMQIGNFVESNEDLVDIEEMEGYKAEDWEELKKEMLAKWGEGGQHYEEGDLLKLATERHRAGGISTVEVYREYTAAFDRVLRYLNKNEIVIGISGTVKRYYLRAFKESDREKIHRQLLIKGLIATAVDGRVTALPEMDVIRDAITRELQLGRMMKEGGSVTEKTEPAPAGTGQKSAEPVTRADLSELTEQMRDMRLFMHRTATSVPFRRPDPVTVSSAGPSGTTPAPVAQPPYPSGPNFVPGPPAGLGGPTTMAPGPWNPFVPSGPRKCEYCLAEDHWRSKCPDFTLALNSGWVRISNRIMYWPNWERLVSDNPKEAVMRRLVELGILPAPARQEGEVSTHVSKIAGAKWRPPAVAAEVRTIRASEAVGFGERFQPMEVDPAPKNTRARETPPHLILTPSKKKATELAKKVLGLDHPVALTLKELAIVSPLMAGELIKALKECAGTEAQEKGRSGEAPKTADVRNAEITPRVTELDLLPTSSVSVPLGFVWMKIADQNVWAMVDSGSMINIIPTELASAACLTLQKTSTSIRTMGGFKQEVDGVVEKQEIEVAKTRMALSFLVTKAPDVILGRPFLFAYNAVLAFDQTQREEVLRVEDGAGNKFETTICQPQSGKWQVSAEEEERCHRCGEPPAEDF